MEYDYKQMKGVMWNIRNGTKKNFKWQVRLRELNGVATDRDPICPVGARSCSLTLVDAFSVFKSILSTFYEKKV
jgi:hypothetical protein